MNTTMIINKLATKRNGQFFKISYASDLPLTAKAKRDGVTVVKFTHATVRKGINYKNLKSVRAKHENDPAYFANPIQLPWGEWNPQHKGLLIEHKNQTYVRLYTSPNKSKSTYFLNGKAISLEDLKNVGVVQNSYWNKSDSPVDCLTLKAANIQDIW